MRWKARITVSTTVAVWALIVAFGPGLSAQDAGHEPLGDILSGFEDPSDEQADDEEAVLEGFDDPAQVSVAATESQQAANGNWRLSADMSIASSYNYAHRKATTGATDYRGLSRLQLQFRPELWFMLGDAWDVKISASIFYDMAYQINGRSNYTDQVLRHYESEAVLRDTFVRGRLTPALDAKLGRQIVVWGKSDSLRVVDILNPLDRREPGLTDLEDLRLPLTMLRLDYYLGSWNLSAIGIVEAGFDKLPAYGSDYYPAAQPLPPEVKPDHGGGNTEYAFALSGMLQGWDISFHLAQVFDDLAHLQQTDAGLRRIHSRLNMAGIAANVVHGDWLIKGEIAYLTGMEFFAAPGREFARTDLLLGVEYNGFDNTTISLERVLRHLHHYDHRLADSAAPVKGNSSQSALRLNADFLYDRLNLLLLAVRYGEALNEGGFSRVQFSYELRQALELTCGVVAYHRGDQVPFDRIANNDRLFISLEYSF